MIRRRLQSVPSISTNSILQWQESVSMIHLDLPILHSHYEWWLEGHDWFNWILVGVLSQCIHKIPSSCWWLWILPIFTKGLSQISCGLELALIRTDSCKNYDHVWVVLNFLAFFWPRLKIQCSHRSRDQGIWSLMETTPLIKRWAQMYHTASTMLKVFGGQFIHNDTPK